MLTLRKPDRNRLNLRCEECIGKNCKDCDSLSQHCVCQSTDLKLENLYEARVLMTEDLPTESKDDLVTTQQVTSCPILSINTSKFYCDYPEKSEWIEAEKICDGRNDCKSKYDEAAEVCQNAALKRNILIPLLCIFLTATIAGTVACACWKVCGCGKKDVADQKPDDKISKALQILHFYNGQ